MEEALTQVAQYFLWSVYINATTLLVIVGMLGYFMVQMKRDTREISQAVRDVAEMTREILRRTQ